MYLDEGWGLSRGNYFLARLIDHDETWKYTNGSGWCYGPFMNYYGSRERRTGKISKYSYFGKGV